MTTRKYSSRSQQTTLTSAVTAGAVTISVGSRLALLGGASISSGQTFTAVIDPDTASEEIVDVTVATSGDTLTVTRGIETGGVGQPHSAGAVIRHMAIGRDYRESNLHIEATGAYNDGTGTHAMHGIASGEGDVVGTTKTQTLTNKDLSSGTNTLPTSVVTLTGSQTLTNKNLTSPVVTGLTLNDSSVVFEGSTADAFETTLTVTDPTADRTITLPNTSGTVAILDAAQTLSNKTLGSNLAAGGFKITGLGTPTDPADAVRKDFADAQVTAAASSATAAASSATAASTSASSASTSASSASTSASAAATSATSAATSASAAATSASSAATSATAAAASFDSFDDRYLGAKASDPTLDNDGNALLTGALYFNTTSPGFRSYTGSAWVTAIGPTGPTGPTGIAVYDDDQGVLSQQVFG